MRFLFLPYLIKLLKGSDETDLEHFFVLEKKDLSCGKN